MRYLHLFLFFIYCGCPAWKVCAQPTMASPSAESYVFKNINQENGLNSTYVYALNQDQQQGFMWIGSTKGLQRYDGLRFLNCLRYGNQDGDINVTALFADGPQHLLYSQGDFALYQWDFLSHKASTIPVPGQFEVYADHDGNKWHLQRYRNNLYRMQKNGKGYVQIASFCNDGKDSWIVAPGFGIFLLDSLHHRLYTTEDNPLQHPLLAGIKKSGSTIRNMTVDHHGNIWLMSWTHPFFCYNAETRTLHSYSIADILHTEGIESSVPGWVSCVLEDDHGVVWLATAKAGLLKYDRSRDQFQYITGIPGNNLSLQYNHQINTIFQDRDENIWLGTDKGISVFNPYNNHFTFLKNTEEVHPAKNETEINTAIETRTKEIWVGSWGGGIRIYDSALKPARQLFFKNKYDENLVWSLLEQPDGSVWAGCQGGVLHKIDPLTLHTATTRPEILGGSTIKCMIRDRDNNILFGLQSGKIIVWDIAAQQFLPLVEKEPARSIIENLYADNGICWATTSAGLRAFDIRKRSFIATYKPKADYAVQLTSMDAWDDSTLLLGTANAGLYFFNKRCGLFSKIQLENEPSFAAACAVHKDKKGNIWYTSDHNIGFYKPQKQFATYLPASGVMQAAFSGNHFMITQKGDWFAWSPAELVMFNPDSLLAFHKTGGLTITGFKVYADPLPIDSLLQYQQPLQLSYRQNFISIEFSDLRFSNTPQTNYYYRLDGVDKDWVSGSTRGYASYTNLNPGIYQFHVKTSNSGSGEPEVSIFIHINAPFWGTTWFPLLCAAILILTAVACIRWYNGRQQQELHIKEQLAQTEMMALRAQMNPHFIFNCINSIDALIQCDDKYLATISLNKFAKLIRNILDSSQRPTTTLSHDLETIRLYIDLEQLRTEHSFTAEINVDEALLEIDCKVPPLIIQPYVENAILHGLRNKRKGGGILRITIMREGEHLRYTIEDNGIGRQAAKSRYHRHQPYGMEMSGNRAKLFNGDDNIPVVITDLEENGLPAGTRVMVALKYCL